jgi:hypothetical protein
MMNQSRGQRIQRQQKPLPTKAYTGKNEGEDIGSIRDNVHINVYHASDSSLSEQSCLLSDDEVDIQYSDIASSSGDNKWGRSFFGYSLVAICTVLIGVFILTELVHTSDSALLTASDGTDDIIGNLFTISNDDYGEFDRDENKYPFLANAQLIEPYRRSTLSLVNASDDDDCTYSLTVRSSSYSESADGSTANKQTLNADSVTVESSTDSPRTWYLTANGAGYFTVSISSTCGDAQTVTNRSAGIWSKYVRRELSTLTESDRKDFLSALYTLYTVNTVDGRKQFG